MVSAVDWFERVGLPALYEGEFSDITMDSRQVRPGSVFFALPGSQVDGVQFIDQAVQKGAKMVVSHKAVPCAAPIWVLKEGIQQAGELISAYFDNPSDKMKVIGVTGTNGKTSVSHYIAQLCDRLNQSAGIIGTNGQGKWSALDKTLNTTPDLISVHRELARQRQLGVELCAMEVSSHGLDQGRTAGVTFDLGIFTNLTRDHLDYHGTMEAYAEAKAKLFQSKGMRFALINVDDVYGAQFVEQFKKDQTLPVVTYGVRAKHADIKMHDVVANAAGTCGRITSPWGEAELCFPLLGEFNVANLLAAVGALVLLGHDFQQVVTQASCLQPVSGRMELMRFDGMANAVVDYAHTPDALKKAIKACRAHCPGDLWVVFGCGGDRDTGKRALMAEIAERYGDHVMVTDDNPRTEDPEHIFNDIRQGFSRTHQFEHDRRVAIEKVMAQAGPNSLVLVAGKGHEDYQEIDGQRLPFSDQVVLRQISEEQINA